MVPTKGVNIFLAAYALLIIYLSLTCQVLNIFEEFLSVTVIIYLKAQIIPFLTSENISEFSSEPFRYNFSSAGFFVVYSERIFQVYLAYFLPRLRITHFLGSPGFFY